jgi:hypothetical protein
MASGNRPPVARFLFAIRHSPLPKDQHQIADVDHGREGLPEDDDRLAPHEPVDERHQPARHREEPESERHDAAAGPFAGDPLHDETGPEQKLRRDAESKPQVEPRHEHVVQIGAHVLR